MATWSIAGNVVTLTLTGAESGTIRRSRTFSFPAAPNKLHTFYLKVNPSLAGLQAFLEVVGGDLTVATVAGLQTLRARGNTDAIGNITIRFGVQLPGGGGTSSSSDALSYASQAAAEAAGWAVTQTNAGGSVLFNSGRALGPHGTSVKFTHKDAPGENKIVKTVAVVNGKSYTVKLWMGVGPTTPWYAASGISGISGANAGGAAINGGEGDKQGSFTIVADGTTLTLTIASGAGGGLFGATAVFYAAGLEIEGLGTAGTVTYTDLEYCQGNGLGDGKTGGGDDGNEPIPPPPTGGWPPPVSGGARPFQIYGVPAGGFAYFNSTVKHFSDRTLVSLLSVASAASSKLMLTLGPESGWLDAAGRFVYERWEAQAIAVANNPEANAALLAAIAAPGRPAWAHMLIDEPFHLRRYGGPIPFATVERMAQKSKQLWPTWTVVLRVDPSDSRMLRKMAGVDIMWAEYKLSNGPLEPYRDSRIAAALAKQVGLVFGLHYAAFDTAGETRYITAAELRHYGGILAAPSPAHPTFRSAAFGGWKWNNALWSGAGIPDAVRFVRDLYASTDP